MYLILIYFVLSYYTIISDSSNYINKRYFYHKNQNSGKKVTIDDIGECVVGEYFPEENYVKVYKSEVEYKIYVK